jgi:hypothetical protein
MEREWRNGALQNRTASPGESRIATGTALETVPAQGRDEAWNNPGSAAQRVRVAPCPGKPHQQATVAREMSS